MKIIAGITSTAGKLKNFEELVWDTSKSIMVGDNKDLQETVWYSVIRPVVQSIDVTTNETFPDYGIPVDAVKKWAEKNYSNKWEESKDVFGDKNILIMKSDSDLSKIMNILKSIQNNYKGLVENSKQVHSVRETIMKDLGLKPVPAYGGDWALSVRKSLTQFSDSFKKRKIKSPMLNKWAKLGLDNFIFDADPSATLKDILNNLHEALNTVYKADEVFDIGRLVLKSTGDKDLKNIINNPDVYKKSDVIPKIMEWLKA